MEAKNSIKSLPAWLSRTRTVAAWLTVVAFISFLIPHIIIERFEPQAFKWASGAPRPPQWTFSWRNVSLSIILVAGAISIPRWQSMAILGLTILLVCYASCGI